MSGFVAVASGLLVASAAAQMLTRSISIGMPQSGFLAAGGSDTYFLSVPRATELVISATKLPGATLDPKVTLRDASGTEIGSDDDSGDDNNALLRQSVQAGSYQLIVSAYGTTSGQYTLSITEAPSSLMGMIGVGEQRMGMLAAGQQNAYAFNVPRPMEVVITVDKVTAMGASGQQAMRVMGRINFQGQEDRYQYLAQSSEPVVIRVDKTTGSNLDPKVNLYNAMGAQLATDDDGGDGLNSLLSYTLSPGTYTIGVASAGTSTGDYEMQVQRGGTAQNLDPKVTLRDASGAEVGSDDDSGEDNNARLSTQIQAGQYQIVVSAYGTTSGGYTLGVSEVAASVRGMIGVGESRAGQLAQGQRDAYQLSVARATDLIINAMKAQTAPVASAGNRLQVRGSVRFSGQEDRYQYQVTFAQPYSIRANKAEGSDLDPKVNLYNAMGTQLASDDDGGGELNSLLSQTLPPGTYTIGVASAGTSTGDYELIVEPGSPNTLDPKVSLRSSAGSEVGSDDDSGEGNDARLVRRVDPGTYQIVVAAYGTTEGMYTLTVAEAVAQSMGAISPGSSRTGTIAGGERQLYSLTVSQTAAVTIDLMKSGESSLDPELALRTSAGSDVATDDDGGEGLNSRIAQVLQPGAYQIVVIGHGASSGAYELRVTSAGGAAATPQQLQQMIVPVSRGNVITFEQDDGGFGVKSDEQIERALAVGKYSVRARRGDHQIYSLPLGRKADGTFTVTVLKMDGRDDEGFGLCLRVHGRGDAPNMYLFEITGGGRYRFRKRVDAEWRDIIRWTDSRAIAKGNYEKNTLSVEATAGHFVLKVNDTIVGAADDATYNEGYVGFSVGEGLHILFDDLEVPQGGGTGVGG